MRDFREYKLKALVSAIVAAQSEFEKIFFSQRELDGDNVSSSVCLSWHGNIKPSNVFVE